MYQIKKGFSKASIMATIRKYNNGSKAGEIVNGKFKCRYQDAQGNRCAIGAFIPDKHPALKEQDVSAPELLVKYPELEDYLPFYSLMSLNYFQYAHDFGRTDNVWENIEKFLDNKCVEVSND